MRKTVSLFFIVVASLILTGCQQILDHKSKAGLQVITDDVPSAVYLNGQYVNGTPLIEKSLKPGEYNLKIEPNDTTLLPYETSIILRKGLLTVVTWKPATRPELSGGVIYEMEQLKDSSKSEVSFISIPEAAIVTLEGKEKEFSPVVFTDVPAGNRSFEITLPSYETQSHTINVQQGYRMLVRIKLAKLQAVSETESSASESATPVPTPTATPTPSATPKPATPKPASGSTLLSTSSATLTP